MATKQIPGRYYVLTEASHGVTSGTIVRLEYVQDDDGRPRCSTKDGQHVYPHISAMAPLEVDYKPDWLSAKELPEIGGYTTKLSDDRKTLEVGCQRIPIEDVKLVYEHMKALREERGLPV